MNNTDDIDLVRKVRAGDILAFELLVKKYEVKLFWFLKKYTSEETLIEEVIQDSLFKLYKNIDRVKDEKGLKSYLYTIAKNQLIDRFRSEKMTLTINEEVLGDDGESLFEEIDKKDIQAKVREALVKLKEKQRRVVEMYFFEELSYKNIGKRLNMPINTIKTNIRRAKSALLKILKNEKK